MVYGLMNFWFGRLRQLTDRMMPFSGFRRSLVSLSLGLLLFGLGLQSCAYFGSGYEDTLVATVYGNRLYTKDLVGVVAPGSSRTDSAAMVQRYVDRWIEQQVLLYHAREFLEPEQMLFEQRIKNYEASLIAHVFETELIRTQMDTVITQKQLLEYYQAHEELFRLRDHIVRVAYVKLPLTVPNIQRVRTLIGSADPELKAELEEFCLQHAATFYLGDEEWLLFSDIMREIPHEISNPESYLRNNASVELTDDYYRYFLRIHEYRLRGDRSPLSFEQDQIRALLLNRRKVEFMQARRRAFLDMAREANRIEIYY